MNLKKKRGEEAVKIINESLEIIETSEKLAKLLNTSKDKIEITRPDNHSNIKFIVKVEDNNKIK